MRKALYFGLLITFVVFIIPVFSLAQNAGIKVLSPNGGEIWKQGETHQINWKSSGLQSGDKIYIDLTTPSEGMSGGSFANSVARIAIGISDMGSFSWTVPQNIPPSSNYKIMITNVGAEVLDKSDSPFTIVSTTPIQPSTTSTQPSITFTSPVGGEIWRTNSSQKIHWDYPQQLYSSNSVKVIVSAVVNNSGVGTSASKYPIFESMLDPEFGGSEIDWNIPTSILGGSSMGSFKIYVDAHNNLTGNDYYGWSNPFAVIQPSITITSPNGGEIIVNFDNKTISAGQVSASTKESIEVKDNRVFLKQTEVKIMPDTASQSAITKLGNLGFKIELKDVGKGEDVKPVYEAVGTKDVKILGLFRVKMTVSANVDAQTGEVSGLNRSWWSFLTW